MATARQRTKLALYAHDLIDHEPEVHYAQIRPYPVHARPGSYPITLDCSSSVTKLCQCSGLKDPNGPAYDYDGFGYTGTLLDFLPHYYSPAQARVGALVVFGPGTGEHVAMVLEPHPRNPLLFSHGMERGPIAVRLHDEAQFHNPPTRFLSIAGL